jgi:dTDP-4-amino-4,6-dideoxygalactose transaminase
VTVRTAAAVPLLDLRAQYATIRDEIREAMDRVIDSQHFILGPEVEAFERDIAAYCGCAFAIGVSSGSDALLVALMAAGVGPGDEVVTTAYSFFASAGAIARLGARPVFVDIDPADFNIDTAKVSSALTQRTKAVMPVHLYGQTADLGPLMELARANGLVVVEDAAQAIGAEHGGRRAGSFGEYGCFSFFPSKNLGAFGDGGLVTANDSGIAERLRLLRTHGAKPKYHSRVIGGNFRLDALQAAILGVKLRHLESWTEGRRRNAARYRTLFAERITTRGPRAVTPPADIAGRRHIYNQFVVRTAEREALQAHLKDRGIGTEVYYPIPLPLMDAFAYLGHGSGEFPESERAARETLALPIYAELTGEQQGRVVDAIVDWQRAV